MVGASHRRGSCFSLRHRFGRRKFRFCASLYGIIRYCVENADGDDEDDDYDYEPTEHDLYKEKDWRD